MLNSCSNEATDPSANRIKIVDFGSAEFMYDEDYDIIGALGESSCSSSCNDDSVDVVITPGIKYFFS